ncbi:hypothetical protein, partial [Vibrio caribbeanicus]
GFKDKAGNSGAKVTKTYTLKPELTLNKIDGVITQGATLPLSGTYQALASTTLVVTDSKGLQVSEPPTMGKNGIWTYELNLSSIAVGEVKVTVKGNGVPPVKSSFIYDNQAPTLDATNDVSYQLEDDALTVTASFSEPVTKPTVSVLNGLQLTWKTDGDPLKKEWVSEPLSLASHNNVESLSFTFTGFQDKAGNAGAEVTSTDTLTPKLTLDAINGGKNVGITPDAKLALSGTYQFLENITLVVIDSEKEKVNETPTMQSDGNWEYELDLSTIAAGQVTVEIKGTNSAQQTVTKQRKFNAT